MELRLPKVADIQGKRVLVRVDFNVPLRKQGRGWKVVNDQRLAACVPTIRFLQHHQATVVLISHLGRPKSRQEKQFSLRTVSAYLHAKMQLANTFLPATIGRGVETEIKQANPNTVFLLENLRYFDEELANDRHFAQALSELADVYINEAFSASHRAHASIVGVPKYLPSFAGFALAKEVATLSKLASRPKRPFVLIIGGAKISDKVGMLKRLVGKADLVLVGGACANTFLKAEGYEIYRSRVEEIGSQGENYVAVAHRLIAQYRTEHVLTQGYIPLPKIIFPLDVVAGTTIGTVNRSETKTVNLLEDMHDRPESEPWSYYDIGPKTARLYAELIAQAGTVFWNGPMGVWENPLYATGTRIVARAIARSSAYSVLGGGDTVAAAHHFHHDHDYSYTSLAGGAALEFLSGQSLPGLQPLLK